MSRATKTVLGLIAVGAVGVVTGILIAPEKGEKTRKQIKDSFGDLGDRLNDFLTDTKKKGEEVISELKEKASQVKDEVENKVRSVKNA